MGCVPSVLEFFSLDRAQQDDLAVAEFKFHGAIGVIAFGVVQQDV